VLNEQGQDERVSSTRRLFLIGQWLIANSFVGLLVANLAEIMGFILDFSNT
jgi:hypothetical protein